jgi:CRISPR-associated protein Cas5d
MGYGVAIRVWGNYACFTRPEMKAERVSYDVITPSAARGVLEAIHWKPAIRWVVDRIHVLNEIRFDNIRRNEVGSKIPKRNVEQAMKGGTTTLCQYASEDRQQRASLVLRDVAYVIEAHFEMTDEIGSDDTPEKHYNMIIRRARQGQCYHRPYLGCREFPAHFSFVEGPIPVSPHKGERDLGWMLLDIDYRDNMTPRFFRATMRDGIIDVPKMPEGGEIS